MECLWCNAQFWVNQLTEEEDEEAIVCEYLFSNQWKCLSDIVDVNKKNKMGVQLIILKITDYY